MRVIRNDLYYKTVQTVDTWQDAARVARTMRRAGFFVQYEQVEVGYAVRVLSRTFTGKPVFSDEA